jgi:hypothetical protein
MNRKRPLRKWVNEEESELIDDFRRFNDECSAQGIDPKTVKHGWFKSKETSLFIKNPNFESAETQKADIIRDKLLEELKAYSPKYKTIKRNKIKDGHLLVIDPADIHIGKLSRAFETGEEYNQQIAVQRVHEGVNGILDKSHGWNIDKIFFICGNDVLHTDTPGHTTKGTRQDTDGMWYDNFMNAKKLYVDIIEMLVTVADVCVIFNPSNHDYISGFFTASILKAHFRHSGNIEFHCDISHRKYKRYYSSLLGFTHGDGAKFQDLPLLMAHESKDWSDTKHRYIFTHHIHHKQSKDIQGVCIESLRSPSSSDSWHHIKGYQHAPKAIEGFVFHKQHGQIARLTHIF